MIAGESAGQWTKDPMGVRIATGALPECGC
jgi:hypothetical protein